MANGKFTSAPETVSQEIAREVEQEYDFVLNDYVKHIYNGEEARNSAVATILIAMDKRSKGVYGLAEKYQKALATEDIGNKVVKTWLFVFKQTIGSKGYALDEKSEPRMSGYIAHLVGAATPDEEVLPKALDYFYRNYQGTDEEKEKMAKDFGIDN